MKFLSICVVLLGLIGFNIRPGMAKEFDFLEQDPRFTGDETNVNDPTHPNFWFYDQYTPARDVLQFRGVRLTAVTSITLPNLVRLSDAFYMPVPTNPSAATYPLTDAEITVLKQYIADAPYTGGRSIIFNLSNGVSAAMVNDLISRLGLTGHMASDNVSGPTSYPLPNQPIIKGPLGPLNSFTVTNSGYFDSLGSMRSLMDVNGKCVLPFVEKADLSPTAGGYFFLLDPNFVKSYATANVEQQHMWVNLVDYVTQDQVFHYNPPPIVVTGPEIQVLDGTANVATGVTIVAFGTTPPGTPVVKTITIKNLGNATLTLGAISAMPNGFTLVSGFTSTSLGANATATFQVSLNATAAGNFSGAFTFANNDADEGPFTVNVQGSVVAPVLAPVVDVLDGNTDVALNATVDFGTTPPGTPVTKTFTVKNTGNATLTLGAISALPSGYTLVSGFGGTSLAPNASTTFQVKLNATAVGSYAGSFNFINNDPNNGPFIIKIQGLVSLPSSTMYVDDGDPGFSTVGSWGSTVENGRYYGNDHSFAIGGHGVNAATYTFTGLTPGIYRVSATWRGDTNRATNSPFVISDGATVLATVRINQQNAPASLADQGFNWGDLGGPYNVTSGTLTVRLSDDADQYVDADAVRVERVGSLANGPQIQVLDGTTNLTSGASSVDFGTTAPGTAKQRTITVRNTGTTTLTLGSIGALPNGFSLVTNFTSTSLQPGEAATFMLQLDAATAGTFSGPITFTDNDTNTPTFSFTVTGAVVAGGAVKYIDDGDNGFTKVGTWGSSVEPGRYYGNDHSYAKGGNGADTASYTFTGLVPGHYRISATYRNDSNRAIAVPYTITDGVNTLATATVNQQIAPSSLLDQGFSWTDLASIDVNSTTCVVTIKDTNDQFLYVDADAIRLERTGELGAAPPPPPPPAQVFYVDDRGQGWSCIGNWGFTAEAIYFNGGHSFAINGGGANVCTWSFSGLAPGKYRVSATWRGDYNRATNSPFTVLDGNTSLGTVIVNQQLQPNSLLDKGLSWGDLGTFTITGTTLNVSLNDNANQYVDADGIRIEKVD